MHTTNRSRKITSTRTSFAVLALAGAALLSACGDDDGSPAVAAPAPPASTTDAGAPTEPTEPTAAPDEPALVLIGESPLGAVLTDGAGFSLYGFTKDTDGRPTCNDACADAWPPLLVDGDALPAGLDPGVFSVVTRDDGSHQLKAGRWPLYHFAGDDQPGVANGQGSGGVWFVADASGALIKT